MKKVIFSLFLLSACSSVSVNIDSLKYNEVLGYGYQQFENRIFSAECAGDEYIGLSEIKKQCLETMSKIAYDNGYDYFTVVYNDGKSTVSLRSYETTVPVMSPVPGREPLFLPRQNIYTATEYTKYYVFVLIDKKELADWKNYYKVSDYYINK